MKSAGARMIRAPRTRHGDGPGLGARRPGRVRPRKSDDHINRSTTDRAYAVLYSSAYIAIYIYIAAMRAYIVGLAYLNNIRRENKFYI